MTRISPQEAINQNVQWFLVQKNSPGHSGGGCVYFGTTADGEPCKCAIGCLLPEEIGKKLEKCGLFVCSLLPQSGDDRDDIAWVSGITYPNLNNVLDTTGLIHREFWISLQHHHDRAAGDSCGDEEAFRQDYQEYLERICAEFSLEFPADLLP